MARILVIEDDPTTLDTYGWVLKDAGHEVHLAPTCRQGLELAQSTPVDVVLADLFLPDGTAIELIAGLRGVGVAVPVIIVTGAGSIETAVEAMRRGALDYVVKPLFGEDLLAKVRAALGSPQDGQAEPRPAAYPHAATRWASLMAALVREPRDVRTIRHWARLVGLSTTTLRDRCRLAQTSAARSLSLARVLRAVVASSGGPWQAAQRLEASDPRTLRRLLARAGLPAAAARVTVDDVLIQQSFVQDPDALTALRVVLARDSR